MLEPSKNSASPTKVYKDGPMTYDYNGVKFRYGNNTELGNFCHKDDRNCIMEGSNAVVVWSIIFTALMVIIMMFAFTAWNISTRITYEKHQ